MSVDVITWFRAKAAESKIEVVKIPLTELAPEWEMLDDGRFGRDDGLHYGLVGVQVRESGEIKRKRPLVEEYGNGVVVVLKALGEELYLLALKAEDGNDPANGYLMFNATLSSSQSNLEAAHGGQRPARADLFDMAKQAGVLIAQPQDGGKYFMKVNYYGVLEVDPADFTPNPNERWCTREEIRTLSRAGLIAEHLSQALFIGII